jgi:hypothetical protein
VRILRACLLLFAGCLTAIVGCKQDDEISVTTVTHPDRQPIHLRVGAIKRDDTIWFFRISGPTADVAKHVAAFDEFVRSVKFAEDKEKKEETATWAEPKGWRKDPPGSMRYAGYRIAAEPKELEVTVTRLPSGDNWLLTNVHRWQKQINLPPAATKADLKPPEVQEEKEITWIDLNGLGLHMVSKPPEPMAANAKKFQLPMQVKKPAQGGGKLPFVYEVPDGWEKAPLAGGFMVERYVIGKGEVQVTLTPARGDLSMNVNRWRKEVGLPGIDNDEVERSAKVIKVADIKSYYVDIDNPRGPAGKNHTLAVIVPMGNSNWFVKMWGPSNLVGQHKNEFETFVKSFKLDAR